MQSCYTDPAGALTLAFQAARPPEAHYTPNLYLSVSVLMVCPFLFLYLLYTLRTQVLLITFTVISSVPALLVCHSALDTDSVRSFYAQLCLWTARLWRPPVLPTARCSSCLTGCCLYKASSMFSLYHALQVSHCCSFTDFIYVWFCHHEHNENTRSVLCIYSELANYLKLKYYRVEFCFWRVMNQTGFKFKAFCGILCKMRMCEFS